MIQKLRMKFIWIFMGSLVLVIVLLMGLVNLLNYQETIERADKLLEVLSENDGRFPMPEQEEQKPEKPEPLLPPHDFSPETPYETRFFVVHMDGEGEPSSTDTGKIAAVDEETAGTYAKKAWTQGRKKGFVSYYRYLCRQTKDGGLIVFLDCSKTLAACRSVLFTSVGVSALGVLLVFAMTFVFSGMVMKPVYESYEKQKRFITDAGHEIRTPLTILDADMDVLEMELGESEWLGDMRKQTQRLSGLTNELIYLARMEEEKPQLRRIELPFSDLVEETAQSFQAAAIIENKRFRMEIQPMLMVCGDEKALRRLTSVLLDNAFKYSDAEGLVCITLEKAGRTARLTVYNTSPSVPKESIGRLFDRFYRADASRNSGSGGYGIGLSIAQAVVRAHRGEIRAQTQDERSLTVTVTLPLGSAKQL